MRNDKTVTFTAAALRKFLLAAVWLVMSGAGLALNPDDVIAAWFSGFLAFGALLMAGNAVLQLRAKGGGIQ